MKVLFERLSYDHKVILLKAFTMLVRGTMPVEARSRWKADGLQQPSRKYTEIAASDELFRDACRELSSLIRDYI